MTTIRLGVRRGILVPLFAAYLLYHPVCVSAANNSDSLSEDDFLGELPVILSATRLVQAKEDVPVATTVIDREMIEASGFTEIPDLLRLAPGFIVNYDSGHIQAASYHMLNERYARRMQVLVDGRSVYIPSLGGVPWTSLGITIDDIERIEVIRGPNAASYGSNSLLGVVSIITRHASLDKGVMARINTGENYLNEGFLRLGGNIGAHDLKLMLAYREDEGFDQRYDSKRVKLANIRGDFQLGLQDTLTLLAGHNDSMRQEDNVFDANIPNHFKKVTDRYQQLLWTRSIDAGEDIKLQYYRQTHDDRNHYLYASLLYLDEGHRSEREDIEFQHNLTAFQDLDIAWGASWRNDKVTSPYYLGRVPTRENITRRLFSNMAWRIDERNLVNAGLMLEDNEITGTDTSPRLALNHKLTATDTLRFSYSTATRTPMLIEEYSDTVIGGVTYLFDASEVKPERIRAYELGYLGQFPQYQSSLDVKIFNDEIWDLITIEPADIDGNLPYHFANVDHANIRGFESTFSSRPDDDTRFEFSFAHVRIRASDKYNSTRYSQSAPLNSFSLLLMHDFSHGYKGSLGAYYASGMKQLATEDLRKPSTRFNLKFGKTFQGRNSNTELSFVMLNMLDAHQQTRLKNVARRSYYVSLRTSFR